MFRGIDFALSSGDILLIEGANGSGKTSLLKAIAGLISFETGQVNWLGEAVSSDPQRFRAALSWFAHRNGLKGDLTPLQNLRFDAGLHSVKSDDFSAALERVGVSNCANLPVRVLSAGQQRRVGLARMLLAVAPLWMLDEPFTNLDTDGQMLVHELVNEHVAAGGLCAMASHQGFATEATVHRVML